MTPGIGGDWSRCLNKSLHEAGLKAIIVSQPMFFTAGCAVEDFNWPDRIILGTTSNDAVLAIKQIFHPLVMRGVPVIVTNHATAELVREAGDGVRGDEDFLHQRTCWTVRKGERRCGASVAGPWSGQENWPPLSAGRSGNGRAVCPVRHGFAGRPRAAE